ncbi:hypothetical protein [Alkaliphilus serpentinus]|uniref:Uncharacterized protein n=1 Tax=Alkaliphilus serpentinus TaxID=1482731 RepID=A0A833HRI6_9FIRM|nr:hypothetical protein [Alkaliphilus serpentinus]KAB3533257.1 hypothetical protein F8153_01560 [Alkaliphilus serpentinus]
MNWGSILVFIAIGIISSIMNKSKEQQRRARSSQGNNTAPRPQVKPQPTMQQAKPKRAPGGLEDLLKEFQRDISTVFGELQQDNKPKDKQVIRTIESKEMELRRSKEEDKTLEATKYTIEDPVASEPESISSIYKNEIGRKGKTPLNLNKKSIMNGIIMAEVLGKPKALQNRF